VEKALDAGGLVLLCQARSQNFLHRQVTYQNACVLRGFTTNGLGNVTKGKIDWIRGFISRELRELGFVGGYDYRGYRGTLRKKRLKDSLRTKG
jgi:hypothetical protein